MRVNLSNLFNEKSPSRKTMTLSSALSNEDLLRKYTVDVELNDIVSAVKSLNIAFYDNDKNSSVILANIKKGGILVDLTGITVYINATENGKEPVTYPCTILDANNGLVEIRLPNTLVDEEGNVNFEFVLQKNDLVITSCVYSYTIHHSIGEGTAGTEEEISLLRTLIQQVQESKTTVDTIVRELEVTQTDIDDILGMVGGL